MLTSNVLHFGSFSCGSRAPKKPSYFRTKNCSVRHVQAKQRYGAHIGDEDVELPKARKHRLYTCSTLSTSAMCTSTCALCTAAKIALFVSSSVSAARTVIARVAPARAYGSETPCPIPRDAPVTSTTLPWYAWASCSCCGSIAGYTLQCSSAGENERLGGGKIAYFKPIPLDVSLKLRVPGHGRRL